MTANELHSHAPHIYPELDRDLNAVAAENIFDDLACYHDEGPVHWLDCPEVRRQLDAVLPDHDRQLRADTLNDAIDYFTERGYAAIGLNDLRDYTEGRKPIHLEPRAAALAGPVERCICTPTECHGAEDHGGPIVCRPCLELDPERDCLAAPVGQETP